MLCESNCDSFHFFNHVFNCVFDPVYKIFFLLSEHSCLLQCTHETTSVCGLSSSNVLEKCVESRTTIDYYFLASILKVLCWRNCRSYQKSRCLWYSTSLWVSCSEWANTSNTRNSCAEPLRVKTPSSASRSVTPWLTSSSADWDPNSCVVAARQCLRSFKFRLQLGPPR